MKKEIKNLFLLLLFFTTLLTGCNTQRLEKEYRKNIEDMQATLKELSKKKGPEPEQILETSLDMLEEAPPTIDVDRAEDGLYATLNIHEEAPGNFFSILSQTYDVGIVMDSQIKAPITLNMTHASIKDVL